MLTRLDPIEDVWRSDARVEYPLAGSTCKYKPKSRSGGGGGGSDGRGLHSSTSRLNLSASCGIGGASRGCLGVV